MNIENRVAGFLTMLEAISERYGIKIHSTGGVDILENISKIRYDIDGGDLTITELTT